MKNLFKKILILIALFASAMVFTGVPAYADTFLPPEPFEIWSEDGTIVLRWCPGDEYNWTWGTAYAGVYRNGELVYSIENLPIRGQSERGFLFSSDFRNFVFIPPTDNQVVAMGFFEDGVLLRSYRIDELVRDINVVTYTVTTASWENWQGRKFDAANNTLTIVTRDDITYVFDITTGEIIYDTAGDMPFIPPRENFFGFFANEGAVPLWAQTPNNDTPSSWAQESVERAGELGILPESFCSDFGRSTTRAEFAAIAVALYEHFREPVMGRAAFTDTSDPSVEKAAYLGIVSGVGNSRFDPYSPITREQAAVMLSRLVEALKGQPMGYFASIRFYDSGEISLWALEGVYKMVSFEIMTGVGAIGFYNRFAPQQPFTREQSIVTILRIFDLVNSEVDVTMPPW